MDEPRKEFAKTQKKDSSIPPLWVVFPDEHPLSICWRMGAGQDHLHKWSKWWKTQTNEEDRIAYFLKRPPPPRWLVWMIDAIWDIRPWEHKNGFDYAPYFIRVEELGLGTKDEYEREFADLR